MTEKYKILLVEDDVINAKLIKDFLIYKGYELFHVNNGFEVVNKIKQYKPDLVLMDIQIFGQSGVDCTREVREIEEFKKLPIFAVSAFSKEKILKERTGRFLSFEGDCFDPYSLFGIKWFCCHLVVSPHAHWFVLMTCVCDYHDMFDVNVVMSCHD